MSDADKTPLQLAREQLDDIEDAVDDELQNYPPHQRWVMRKRLEYDYFCAFISGAYRELVKAEQRKQPTPRNLI